MMKPGANLVAVLGINGADAPNPAGLIGSLVLKYRDGRTLEVPTDGTWQAALTVKGKWNSDAAASQRWTAALELGPLGMSSLGKHRANPDRVATVPGGGRHLPAAGQDGRAARLQLPHPRVRPIACVTSTARIGGNDVYFVANKTPQAEDAVCCFRVHDRRPELWWPETGRIEPAAVYDQADGCVRLPLHLDPSGSVFVVFRGGAAIEPDRITSVSRDGQRSGKQRTRQNLPPAQPAMNPITLIRRAGGRIEAEVRQPGSYVLKTAAGQSRQFNVAMLPEPQEIAGPMGSAVCRGWRRPGPHRAR